MKMLKLSVALSLIAVFMFADAGSVGESSYETVSESTSSTYSEASDWSYDSGDPSSSFSDSNYGSYYEHRGTNRKKARLPSFNECCFMLSVLAIICCVKLTQDKMNKVKIEKELAERDAKKRAKIEELV